MACPGDYPASVTAPHATAEPTFRPWPWWLALFDAVGIILTSLWLARMFVAPIASPLVHALLPGFGGTVGGDWGVYLLVVTAAEVFQILLTVIVVGLRGPLMAALPWQPLRPAWRRTLLLSAAAFTIQIAGALLTFWRFPDAIDHDTMIYRFLMQSPLAGLTLVTGAVLAPVAEEMLFRGFLLSAFSGSRLGWQGGAVVTSLLWSLLHFYSLPSTLLVFAVGLMLSFLVNRTRSLLPGIVLHGLYNLGALLTLALRGT